MARISLDSPSGRTSNYSINPASQTSSYSSKPAKNQTSTESNSTQSNKERDTVFTPEFLEDLANWIKNDRKTASKVLEFVEAVVRDPFQGLGKPEKLKHRKNIWSRRITEEHRLVYQVSDSRIDFLQARYHY